MRPAAVQQSLHFPQRVLAAKPWTEAVTVGRENGLEYRLPAILILDLIAGLILGELLLWSMNSRLK
jgi:hypothetical protein